MSQAGLFVYSTTKAMGWGCTCTFSLESNRATSLIYIQALAEGILTPHGRVRVGVIENPGNNQLGDNAAAAIASLIHALPKLKSLLLAGNILGSLASGQVAVDQVSMDMIFGAALGN